MRHLKISRGRVLRTSLSAAILAGAGATALALAHPAAVQASLGAMSSGPAPSATTTASCKSANNTGCVTGTNSGLGAGVLGKNTDTTGTGSGVFGIANGVDQTGVAGSSSKGTGVGGAGASSGVFGGCISDSTSCIGVDGFSEEGVGVAGSSINFAGVTGTSSAADGVDGSSTNSGNGVTGTSSTAGGIAGYGVEGNAPGKDAGVGGFNTDTTVNEAAGVYGFSSEGYGVYGQTGSSSSYGLYSEGNAFVDGEIFTSGGCQVGCTSTRHVAAFASRTTQPTIDDVGETVLRDGAARVALAADFANTIDLSKPYVVMLTPEGDAALYVASRTPRGFEVRQVGGGRSSIAFAYRIVAKPYGFRDERLPFKTVSDGPAFKQHQIAHPPALPH